LSNPKLRRNGHLPFPGTVLGQVDFEEREAIEAWRSRWTEVRISVHRA
jgi:hypothetical protein